MRLLDVRGQNFFVLNVVLGSSCWLGMIWQRASSLQLDDPNRGLSSRYRGTGGLPLDITCTETSSASTENTRVTDSESHEVGGMTLKPNTFAPCPSYGLPLAVDLQRSSVWAHTQGLEFRQQIFQDFSGRLLIFRKYKAFQGKRNRKSLGQG